MYPKGSAAYWDLKDKQEQQLFDSSSDDNNDANIADATPRGRGPQKRPRTPIETPVSSRKSRRLSTHRKLISDQHRFTEKQIEELADRDRSIEVVMQDKRSLEQRLARFTDTMSDEKRKYELAVASLECEVKELERNNTEKSERLLEEQRRRGCLQSSYDELSETCTAEKEANHILRRKLELAEARTSEGDVSLGKLRADNAHFQSERDSLQSKVAKMQTQFEASEAQRIEAQNQQYNNSELTRRLNEAEALVASLQTVAAAHKECEKTSLALQHSLDDEMAKAKRNHDLHVISLTSTADVLRIQVKQLEEQLKAPREDNVMRYVSKQNKINHNHHRGQVNELLRENSRVREEKREIQKDLNKANINARRYERKVHHTPRPTTLGNTGQCFTLRNPHTFAFKHDPPLHPPQLESLQKQFNESQEQASLVPDMQQRLEDLEAQVANLPVVYDPASSAEEKVTRAVAEMRRAQEKEQTCTNVSNTRLKSLNDAQTLSDSLALELEGVKSENGVLRTELAALTNDIRELRRDREERLERETEVSARLVETKSRDEEEATLVRRSLEGVTKQVRQEVRDVDQAFSSIFGWKIARGRHPISWRVAPVNKAGKAQWKSSELCVQSNDEGDYTVCDSPLLQQYEAEHGSGSVARPSVVCLPRLRSNKGCLPLKLLHYFLEFRMCVYN